MVCNYYFFTTCFLFYIVNSNANVLFALAPTWQLVDQQHEGRYLQSFKLGINTTNGLERRTGSADKVKCVIEAVNGTFEVVKVFYLYISLLSLIIPKIQILKLIKNQDT